MTLWNLFGLCCIPLSGSGFGHASSRPGNGAEEPYYLAQVKEGGESVEPRPQQEQVGEGRGAVASSRAGAGTRWREVHWASSTSRSRWRRPGEPSPRTQWEREGSDHTRSGNVTPCEGPGGYYQTQANGDFSPNIPDIGLVGGCRGYNKI